MVVVLIVIVIVVVVVVDGTAFNVAYADVACVVYACAVWVYGLESKVSCLSYLRVVESQIWPTVDRLILSHLVALKLRCFECLGEPNNARRVRL